MGAWGAWGEQGQAGRGKPGAGGSGNAGGDHFDTKPIRFQQLLEKVDSLLAGTVAR